MKTQHHVLEISGCRSGGTGLQRLRRLLTVFSTLATAVLLGMMGSNAAIAANPDTPSGMPVSPLFGATDFSQQMLRFEEFDRDPFPDDRPTVVKTFPLPQADATHTACQGAPDGALIDAFLEDPLYPAPSRQANDADPNPVVAAMKDTRHASSVDVEPGQGQTSDEICAS